MFSNTIEPNFFSVFDGFDGLFNTLLQPLKEAFQSDERTANQKAEQRLYEVAIAIASPFFTANSEKAYAAAVKLSRERVKDLRIAIDGLPKKTKTRTQTDELRPPKFATKWHELMLDYEEAFGLVRPKRARPGFRQPPREVIRELQTRSLALMIPVMVAAVRSDDAPPNDWAMNRAHGDARRLIDEISTLLGLEDGVVVTSRDHRLAKESDERDEQAWREDGERRQALRDEDLDTSAWIEN
jgi:hypothetical protein